MHLDETIIQIPIVIVAATTLWVIILGKLIKMHNIHARKQRQANSHVYLMMCMLAHEGRVTHICVSRLTIIGCNDGLEYC